MIQSKHPRLVPLLMVVLGAAAVGSMALLGANEMSGRTGARAMLIVGIGGIAFGTGLTQLVWPAPPPADESDDRHFFSRARWPQRILYVLGGLIGIVAAAVLLTVASGKY